MNPVLFPPPDCAWLILLLPLVSAVLIGLVTRRDGLLSARISIAAVVLSFVVSAAFFLFRENLLAPGHGSLTVSAGDWLAIGPLRVDLGITLDRLSLLMLLVVTGVGSAIHVYSYGYMKVDPCVGRFFGSLSLFMFSMLGIVLADNLVMMFIFWELVGVSSYLLIGFWYERPAAADACKKAFLTNRLGDFGFILGIILVWATLGSVGFGELAARVAKAPEAWAGVAALAGLLLFAGAMGKSAQFPLHVWLPDAMEGPTPVSALIHADEANLRAAFEYALSGGESSDAEMVLRIALILYALGRARGSLPETLRTLYRALAFVQKSDAQTSAGQIHARALLACGELTQLSRGIEPARPFLHAALPLARKSNQPDLTARTLRALADNALFGEEYDAALPLYEEALRIQRTTGNERGAAQTLNSLALLARRKNNDFAEAARLTRESGDYFRRVGDKRMLSYNLFNRGELALEQNEMEEAEPYFRESLALAQEMRDDWQCLYVLFALARTAGRRGQLAARRDLMREVLPLALRIGDVPVLVDALREQADLAKSDGDKRGAVTLLSAAHAIAQGKPVNSSDAAASAAVLSGLGERSFQAAWNRGAVLTPEQAVHLALAAAVPHESP